MYLGPSHLDIRHNTIADGVLAAQSRDTLKYPQHTCSSWSHVDDELQAHPQLMRSRALTERIHLHRVALCWRVLPSMNYALSQLTGLTSISNGRHHMGWR